MTVKAIAPACVSKEFSAWATGKTSPVVEWSKALARHEHERLGGPGVGVVGMCFTGNFALAMLPEPAVQAPVHVAAVAAARGSARRPGAASTSATTTWPKVQDRMAAEPDLCVLGLRFTDDKLVPAERFAHLREALGDRFVGVEIDSSKGNPWGHPRRAHSVLTEHLDRRAGSAHPGRAGPGPRPVPHPPARQLRGRPKGSASCQVRRCSSALATAAIQRLVPSPARAATASWTRVIGSPPSASTAARSGAAVDEEVGHDHDARPAEDGEGPRRDRHRGERHDHAGLHGGGEVVLEHAGLAGHQQDVARRVEGALLEQRAAVDGDRRGGGIDDRAAADDGDLLPVERAEGAEGGRDRALARR